MRTFFGQRFRRTLWQAALAASLLFAFGCRSGSGGDTTSGPPVMTITDPTSQPTYSTQAPSLRFGGTLVGLSDADFFPFGTTARVRNGANGSFSAIRISGNPDFATWETVFTVSLEPGVNEIVASGEFRGGAASDSISVILN